MTVVRSCSRVYECFVVSPVFFPTSGWLSSLFRSGIYVRKLVLYEEGKERSGHWILNNSERMFISFKKREESEQTKNCFVNRYYALRFHENVSLRY